MLVVLRIGVAIGEAGSVPGSLSLIADYYPPRRRATAMSTWGLALPAGLMVGYAGTGWLAGTAGWRITFAVVGCGAWCSRRRPGDCSPSRNAAGSRRAFACPAPPLFASIGVLWPPTPSATS